MLAQLKEMGFLDQETLEKGLNVYTYLDPEMQTKMCIRDSSGGMSADQN